MDRRKRTARTVALMSLFSMTDTQENVPVASFVGDGSDLVSLIVGIDPVQAGSGDPSPDNVRPISGWTECKVYVSHTQNAQDATVYTIDLDGTVYGGTLDVTTGKLTVDRKFITLLPTMSWQYSTLTQRFFVVIGDAAARAGEQVTFGGKCNMFKAGKTGENNAVSYVNATSPGFAITYQAVNGDMAAWKQFLTDNTVNVVYELATPIVYDLTPTEINTLIGTNNICADTGEIKYIEYNV